ncbi:MAG: hypothetical protein V7727_21590, partial [Sneathiella sp.]
MKNLTLNLDELETKELGPIASAAVDVGVGKTEAAIQIIKRILKNNLTDCKESEAFDIKFIYAVPTHKLGEELANRFRAEGITAGVWRGRLADNPDKPNEKMCLKPNTVEKVISMGQPVQTTMCRSKIKDTYYDCEHFQYCPYQGQTSHLTPLDVVIVPHASLFFEIPDIGKRQILIIDESFWPAGLRGV